MRGTDPVARMTDGADSTVPASGPSTTSTRPDPARRARPDSTVTDRLASTPASPFVSRSTTDCLRAWLTAKSRVGELAVTPNSEAALTVRQTAAVSRNSLAGMHPRCRQVPPTFSISIIATVSPAEAP